MTTRRENQQPLTVYMLCASAFLFTAVVGIYAPPIPLNESSTEKENYAAAVPRKLLISSNTNDYGGVDGGDSPDRIGIGGQTECSKDSILVFQGPSSPLPSGIPTYTANVENVCVSESCSISAIHLSCGWFSSARTINPAIFRRLDYNDCLVNDGQPLNPGESVSFQYANTFMYPLAVSSVTC